MILFSSTGGSSKLAGQYSIRQLISHEIEAELLRRHEHAADKLATTTKDSKKTAAAAAKESIKPPQQIPAEKLATDFFGRVVTKPTDMDVDSVTGNNQTVKISDHIYHSYHVPFVHSWFIPKSQNLVPIP